MPRWTAEARQRQRELIQQWKPWSQSTGPKTAEGKAMVSQNARSKDIHRLYKICRVLGIPRLQPGQAITLPICELTALRLRQVEERIPGAGMLTLRLNKRGQWSFRWKWRSVYLAVMK